jgi:hypothetical protein
VAGELDVPLDWFEGLAEAGRALYIEPGLWIAAEQAELYGTALQDNSGLDLTAIPINKEPSHDNEVINPKADEKVNDDLYS